MAKLSVVAIAKTVIGTKETLLALCPGEVGILVKTLFYEEEIAENPKAFAHPKLVKAESDMAKQLIQSMTKPLIPVITMMSFRNDCARQLKRKSVVSISCMPVTASRTLQLQSI